MHLPQGRFKSASGETVTVLPDGRVLLKAAPKKPELRPLEGLPDQKVFGNRRALRELMELVGIAYDAQLKRLLKVIDDYVTREVLPRKGPHLFLPADMEKIRALVTDYHRAFIIGTVHPEAAPPATVQRLMDEGVLPQDLAYIHRPDTPRSLPPSRMSFIDTSFAYGLSDVSAISPSQDPVDASEITLGSFHATPARPLTTAERASRDWARHSAAMHITGLGDRFSHDLSVRAIEADAAQRRRYEEVIRDKLDEHVAKRTSWRKLADEIGEATGDWSRNLKRIAATESHSAMQAGIVADLQKRENKTSAQLYVAKQPAPDACRDCVRLHLTAGFGSSPRIFKLSELEANGTNVGKKRAAWNVVVGATHPWCGCDLIHIPEGWKFDSEGDLVPELLSRSDWLEIDLRKASDMTYGGAVPERGVVIRVGDPRMRVEVERIVAKTPPEVFDKRVGVTLITTDTPRIQNPLEEHDFAYWTANEIRLMHNLPWEKIERVLPHEIGHSLNVYLMRQMGGTKPVRAWHDQLWAVSKEEGWVSDYARKLPIENAAEVSMLYLYNKKRLMLMFPRQFAFVHKYYRPIFRKKAVAA